MNESPLLVYLPNIIYPSSPFMGWSMGVLRTHPALSETRLPFRLEEANDREMAEWDSVCYFSAADYRYSLSCFVLDRI